LIHLSCHADLGKLSRDAASLPRNRSGAIDAATDAEFAPSIHQTFCDLPRRVLLDNRFWQWLACMEMRDYVRLRWASKVDFGVDPVLTPAQQARFLGNRGLNGMGRNALSRLFWTAEVMGDAQDDYGLTRRLLAKQDLTVGVIERSFGLIPAVARACARNLVDVSEDEHREALKRLNLRASTVALEGASEDDVARLLVR
jgi:hypothetical protein